MSKALGKITKVGTMSGSLGLTLNLIYNWKSEIGNIGKLKFLKGKKGAEYSNIISEDFVTNKVPAIQSYHLTYVEFW